MPVVCAIEQLLLDPPFIALETSCCASANAISTAEADPGTRLQPSAAIAGEQCLPNVRIVPSEATPSSAGGNP